jgi:predicted nucleotidyltransferase
MDAVLPKDEIYRRVDAMRKNRRKGFSMKMFAEFACMNYRHFEAVLRDRKDTFTESSQRKVSKALLALEKARLALVWTSLANASLATTLSPSPSTGVE